MKSNVVKHTIKTSSCRLIGCNKFGTRLVGLGSSTINAYFVLSLGSMSRVKSNNGAAFKRRNVKTVDVKSKSCSDQVAKVLYPPRGLIRSETVDLKKDKFF